MEEQYETSDNPNPAEERHYTIAELADMWKVLDGVRSPNSAWRTRVEWVRAATRKTALQCDQGTAVGCRRLYRRALARSMRKKVQRSPGPTDVVFELLLARLHPRSVVTFGDLDPPDA